MNLFRKQPPAQTEAPAPAPEPLSPLAAAEAELAEASRACTEAHKKCERLDNEQRFWLRARENASMEHSKALNRHAAAKDAWLRLSNPSPVVGSGHAVPVPEVVGAVVVTGEK
jgi:hypothetical protein